MKNIIITLSCVLCLVSCVSIVNAQNSCPNIRKCGDTLIDSRDGYHYPTVQIGTQCWLQANMQAFKYLNGDPIPNVTNSGDWQNLSSAAWCDYNNDASNAIIYGHFYNWWVIKDPRCLCPKGWHVPTYNEWNILFNYLGGISVAAGAMKSTSPLWQSPNTGATNSSGFTGLPGGYRSVIGGRFFDLGQGARWWGAPVDGVAGSWRCYEDYDAANAFMYTSIYGTYGDADGFSVRCLKDY